MDVYAANRQAYLELFNRDKGERHGEEELAEWTSNRAATLEDAENQVKESEMQVDWRGKGAGEGTKGDGKGTRADKNDGKAPGPRCYPHCDKHATWECLCCL